LTGLFEISLLMTVLNIFEKSWRKKKLENFLTFSKNKNSHTQRQIRPTPTRYTKESYDLKHAIKGYNWK
jgi:hypothetical protein